MANALFDANKELKSNVDKLMKTAGDAVCVPLTATYTMLTKQVNIIIAPAGIFKDQIISGIDGATTAAFNEITNALNLFSSNMPPINLTIKASTLQDLNIFKKTCLDFNDILPNAMKDLISEGIDLINEGVDDFMSELPEFSMPEEIQDMIDYSMDMFQENALSDALSEAASLALSPLKMYRDFIKSTGIVELLKRLQKFEKCMTNPKNCNRPKKEFYFPGTRKYNSQYYMDLLAINLKGEIQLKKITKQVKGIETKAAKTMKGYENFKLIK